MNVGYEIEIELLSALDGKCTLHVVYDVNHYFHTDYMRGYYQNGQPKPQVYNEDDYARVYYVMRGPSGKHTLSGEGRATSRERLQKHWVGFVGNNCGGHTEINENYPGLIEKLPRNSYTKKYWS